MATWRTVNEWATLELARLDVKYRYQLSGKPHRILQIKNPYTPAMRGRLAFSYKVQVFK